jgi:hypothetical protein
MTLATRSNQNLTKYSQNLLKNLGPEARDTLLIIYNKFRTSNMSLPADWAKAVVIPILKLGKPTEEMT